MLTATATLQETKEAGIDLAAVTAKLESDGIDKFIEAYEKLLAAINKRQA